MTSKISKNSDIPQWNAQVLSDLPRNTLGEGACYDDRINRLYWVDITSFLLRWVDFDSGKTDEINLGQEIGCAVITSDINIILAGVRHGLVKINLKDRSFDFVCKPEGDDSPNRWNDGKCDPRGNFWGGTMPMQRGRTGSLYSYTPDGTCTKWATGIGCSNGLAWSADLKKMYYIDTHDRAVDVFDYDVYKVSVANRRHVVTLAEDFKGGPDGMCIDNEGKLWVALWGGWGVARFDPETGEQIGKIELPVECVTTCCFGGKNFDTLFITSACISLTHEQREVEQPLAGMTFSMKPGVTGPAATPFPLV